MFNKYFSNLVNKIQASDFATKKISRRDFVKGTGLLFAFLSLGGASTVLPKVKTTPQEKIKPTGGYGNSGYGS